MKHLIINTLLALCACLHAPAQIVNPSFSDQRPGGDIASWQIKGQIIKADTVNARTAPTSLYMYNMDYGTSKCSQVAPFHPGKYKRYKLKVFIRTETRYGYASAWVKTTDSKNGLIYYDTLPSEEITGKTKWKEYELVFRTTADVAFVEVGVSLTSKGKAWFDDLSIEELPDTDIPKNKIAEQYVGEVYNILENQGWYADSVNLKEAYEHSLELAADATSTGDCYAAVGYLLDRLGDRNGQFYDPATTRNWYKEQKINDEQALYPTVVLNSGLAMIWLPGLTSINKAVLQRYADTLHKQLANLDQNEIKGWIVDLRENVGGNATAMLAAIGPLLDQKVCGKYIRRKGTIDWTYDNGKANIDTTTITVTNPYTTKTPGLPLAILTSQQTYGAAELVVIALKGRDNIRSFGEPTVGVTINEKRITLSDGAMLFFTAGITADAKGHRYHGRIQPDLLVPMIFTEDHCLGKAIRWLKEQKAN